MKKRKLISALLALCLLSGCAPVSDTGSGSSDNGHSESYETEQQEFSFTLRGGNAIFQSVTNAKRYRVSANGTLLGYTQTTEFAVVDKILEKNVVAWGEWKICVEALDDSDRSIALHEQKMKIRALNSNNFQTELNGDYSANDYFMLEEDIFYFGHDNATLNEETPYGYTFAKLVYYGEGMKGFVTKAFSATLDGNGYTVNLLVDRPLMYHAELQMAAGGLLTSVTQSGVLKNLVVNADYTYPQEAGQFSAPVVYKDCAGLIENCWFNTILRPIACDKDVATGEFSFTYEYDARASVIGSTSDGFICKNTVFIVDVMDVNGNLITAETYGKMGGAVCISRQTSRYENCVFIQNGGAPRFINDTWAHAQALKGSSLANGAYYYSSIQDFLSGGVGYRCDGEMKDSESFVKTDGVIYENWGDAWEISESEVYISGALAYAN